MKCNPPLPLRPDSEKTLTKTTCQTVVSKKKSKNVRGQFDVSESWQEIQELTKLTD